MKVVLSLFILLALPFQELFAQSFKGKIIDATTKETLSFANVVLLQAVDSAFVTGTVSGDDGTFSLVPPAKKSILRISLIGYETYTEPFHSQNQSIIALNPKQEMLSEVVVTGHARLFKMENGGISADIQNTPLKTIGNLSEVLGQMPFVTKTDNTLTVLGKGTPIVYINNRLVRDNNDLLRINSKDIKKVTVITNPGAEYDASVNAVIKVETARPIGERLSVDLWTYNRYNSEWFTMNRASLNYRNDKLDIFASIEYSNLAFPKDRVWNTDIQTNEETHSIRSRRSDSDMLKYYTPKVGFNYIVNKDHSFGIQYEFSDTYDSNYDYHIDTESYLDQVKEESVHTQSLGKDQNQTHYVNAYYNGQIASWLNAKLDMDYKTYDGNGQDKAINTQEDLARENLRTLNVGTYNLYAAKLTLQTPLWNGNLTYGGEGSYIENEQATSIAENNGIQGINSSENDIKQKLYAGFISYNRTFGLFSGDVGLRYENINTEYYENGQLIKEQTRKHRRLFPNLRISYSLNENLQMELSYRNTVSRPSYSSLRSFIAYMGPFQYATGNPLLQPTYTNSLTYMLRWRQFTLMGIYQKHTDYITEMSEIYMGNSVLNHVVNINNAQFLIAGINYNSAFGIWRPNYDISVAKNYITYGEPSITYNKPVFNFNARNSFSIKGWNLGIDITGRSKGNSNGLTYHTKFSWGTDIYINTSFFKDQLLVGLRGIDIFNTNNDDFKNDFNGIHINWKNQMYRRTFMFSMTYRFNASPQRYKGNNATDEIHRL